MKKKSIILAVAAAIAAAVALLTLFADCFYETDGNNSLGSVYTVMFGLQNFNPSVPMILGFSGLCVAFVSAIVSAILFGKGQTVAFGVTAVLLVAGGVLMLLSKNFFLAANAGYKNWFIEFDDYMIGVGPIVSSVFSFIGALVCGYAAYDSLKED